MALAIGALPDQLIKTDWVDTARTNNRAGGETQFQTKDFATFFIRGAKVPSGRRPAGAAGLRRDLAVLERCDELWLVGPRTWKRAGRLGQASIQ